MAMRMDFIAGLLLALWAGHVCAESPTSPPPVTEPVVQESTDDLLKMLSKAKAKPVTACPGGKDVRALLRFIEKNGRDVALADGCAAMNDVTQSCDFYIHGQGNFPEKSMDGKDIDATSTWLVTFTMDHHDAKTIGNVACSLAAR